MSQFTTTNPDLQALLRASEKLRDLYAISSLLSWDQETYLPRRAAYGRAQQLETLAGIIHDKATAKSLQSTLSRLEEQLRATPQDFTMQDQALVRLMRRDFDMASKLPRRLVEELSKLSSLSLEAWRSSRTQNTFALFAPSLSRMVELKIEVAHAYGFTDSPYDALLDEYDEGLRVKTVTAAFNALVPELTEMASKLTQKTADWDHGLFKKSYDEHTLRHLTLTLLAKLGFDLESGRQDESTHPFTVGMSASDVRLTTRLLHDNPLSTIFSSIHEGGHGMYEQGVAPEYTRSRLGQIDSLIIHESQSRFFENIIGRSRPFWEYFFPLLQATFPKQLAGATATQAWEEANLIRPSLIRVDADEVTYHLHIAIRFEIEKALIEKTLAVADVPEMWAVLYQKYLGVTVPDDLHGALQDIHWSQGLIGYFPTYSLGSFLSAQLFETLHQEHPDFDSDVRQGKFAPIREWLGEKIHTHGSLYASDEIALKLTGKNLGSSAFIAYIEKKFGVR